MRIARGLVVLCLLSAAPAARAFTIEQATIDRVGEADLVATAQAVKTQRVQVAPDFEYEVATFAVERAMRGTPAAIGTAHGLPRICLFRQTKSDDREMEDHPITAGGRYLLILKRLPSAGSYGLLSDYQEIPDASDENVREVRKRLFGTEEEPLALEPLPLEAAEALAARILGDIVTTTAQRIIECPDAPTRNPEIYNNATEIGTPIESVRDDRRLLECAARIEGLFNFDDRPFQSPGPNVENESWYRQEPRDETPCAIIQGCRCYVRDIMYLDNTTFPGALVAYRDAPTTRGTVTAMVALRIAGGLYGDYLTAAEARRVSLGGLSFPPPDDWEVERSDEEATVDLTPHDGEGRIRIRVPREDAWDGEKTAPRALAWDGVRAMMRFQARQQALTATEAESVSLTAEPRVVEIGGRAAVRLEGLAGAPEEAEADRFELIAIEGKTPVLLLLRASKGAWAARAAELEEMLAGMRREP